MNKFEVWKGDEIIDQGRDLSVLIDEVDGINEPVEVWSVTWDEVCFSRTQCQLISTLDQVMHVNRAWREMHDPNYGIVLPYRPDLDDGRFFPFMHEENRETDESHHG